MLFFLSFYVVRNLKMGEVKATGVGRFKVSPYNATSPWVLLCIDSLTVSPQSAFHTIRSRFLIVEEQTSPLPLSVCIVQKSWGQIREHE